MPVALISTSTSPDFGPSMSIVSISKGSPAFQATAARVFIGTSFFCSRNRLRLPRRCGGACAFALRLARLVDNIEQRAQRLLHAVAGKRRNDQRRFLRCGFQERRLLLDLRRRQRVGFGQRDYLRLLREPL